MATFTMALHEVIERNGGTVSWENGRCRLADGNIGLDHYPLHDETHRGDLNGLIVDRYYNREIGQESLELFTMAMRRRMNEIMPYYNELYRSLEFEYDPLSTVDMTTETTGTEQGRTSNTEGQTSTTVDETETTTTDTGTSTSDSTTASTGSSASEAYEYPQQQLGADGQYATSASKSASESGSTSGSESESTAESATTGTAHSDGTLSREGEGESELERASTSRTYGYQGSAVELLARFREMILNIDLMIVEDLSDLFMLIWDNGDEYSDLEAHFSW